MADDKAGGPGCGCPAGADGARCVACLLQIGALAKDLAGLIMDGQRRIDEKIAQAAGLCGTCARRDWDLALSCAVAELGTEKTGHPGQRLGSIVGAAMRLVEAGKLQGVAAYPLTEKVLTDMATALAAAQPPG